MHSIVFKKAFFNEFSSSPPLSHLGYGESANAAVV